MGRGIKYKCCRSTAHGNCLNCLGGRLHHGIVEFHPPGNVQVARSGFLFLYAAAMLPRISLLSRHEALQWLASVALVS